jgi:hypothetical protein
MEKDDRRGSSPEAGGKSVQRTPDGTPGKVTRTSKLPGGRTPVVQRQATDAGSRPAARSASDQTGDAHMDMAHRGLTALAGAGSSGAQQQPVQLQPEPQQQQPQQQQPQQQQPQQGAVDPQQAIRAAAAALVDIGGTAAETDRQLVVAELVKLPMAGLRALALANKRVVVCRDSVTEIRIDLRGVRPRGWPEGRTWDTVPGLNDPNNNRVIIATRNGRIPPTGDGHAASNLVLHEVGHAVDDAVGGGSNTQEFQRARTADAAQLGSYFTQAGAAGLRETYAESLARFYGNDPNDAATYPNLHAYWASDPLARAMRGR